MPTDCECPNDDTLEAWLGGRLDEDRARAAEEHVLACEHCAARLSGFDREDRLVQALRAPASSDDLDATRLIASMIGRLREAGVGDGWTQGTVSAPAVDPSTGVWYLENYRIEALIGAGGMGRVYRAFDKVLRRHVAIKIMRGVAANRPGTREQFLREARTVASLHHDHIVSLYHIGEAIDELGGSAVPFLVMPLLRGESLETYARRRGRLELAEVERIGVQIAQALAVAHEAGVIHRDIKPANIWLETNGEPASPGNYRVKLLDFGLALDARSAESESTRGGTPGYMAPEQASGESIDPRADLYAVGGVLKRLATGRIPGAPDSPGVRQSSGLSTLIDELLSLSPEGRPATARQVADRIRQLERTRRRRGVILISCLVLGLASILGIARFIDGWASPPPDTPAVEADPPRLEASPTAIPLQPTPPTPAEIKPVSNAVGSPIRFVTFTDRKAWRQATAGMREDFEGFNHIPSAYFGTPKSSEFEGIRFEGFTLSGTSNGNYVGISSHVEGPGELRWTHYPWIDNSAERGDEHEGPRIVFTLDSPATAFCIQWRESLDEPTYQLEVGGTTFTDPPFSSRPGASGAQSFHFGVLALDGATFNEVVLSRPRDSADFFGTFALTNVYIRHAILPAQKR